MEAAKPSRGVYLCDWIGHGAIPMELFCEQKGNPKPTLEKLTMEQMEAVESMKVNFPRLFFEVDRETNVCLMHINKDDAPPVHEVWLWQSPKAHAEMHCQVLSMLEGTIVWKSQCSYCSPVLLVNKNGRKQFCVKFCKLNDVTNSK